MQPPEVLISPVLAVDSVVVKGSACFDNAASQGQKVKSKSRVRRSGFSPLAMANLNARYSSLKAGRISESSPDVPSVVALVFSDDFRWNLEIRPS